MKDKFLPIGSIVTYKRIDLMIIGYFPKVIDDKIKGKYKDYVCCVYPVGMKDNRFIMINEEEIEKVKFMGYQIPQQIKFLKGLKETKGLYKKGMTDEQIIEYFKNRKEES